MDVRSAGVRLRCGLLAVLAAVACLPACGGGAADGGGAGPSGFTLKNNELTFGGQSNTHVIVGYRLLPMDGSEVIVSGPLGLAPGASIYQQVPSGLYHLTVTYDDGRSERLQIPPDQVDAPAESGRDVTFLY